MIYSFGQTSTRNTSIVTFVVCIRVSYIKFVVLPYYYIHGHYQWTVRPIEKPWQLVHAILVIMLYISKNIT